jgi:hypothetical protein
MIWLFVYYWIVCGYVLFSNTKRDFIDLVVAMAFGGIIVPAMAINKRI